MGQVLSKFEEPNVTQQPGQPVTPALTPDTQSVQRAGGMTQPSLHYNPGGSLGIPGTDPYTSARLYMEKPEEYAKLRMGPNDWETLVRALGRRWCVAAARAVTRTLRYLPGARYPTCFLQA